METVTVSATSLPGAPEGHGGPPALALRGVSFSYAGDGAACPAVLAGASCEVASGAFVLLTGETGSGKTTLLRLAKPELAPAGTLAGTVEVFGRDVRALDAAESARLVGYVFQSPDNQIVCDTVWHEMAFGLENLGLDQREMHQRMAETCNFLGIERLFRRRCDELSGGQRQMVALAAVLAMRPRLLLLDEPTAMLDPVAAQEFCGLLFRANRELGITCVVATHDPAPMVAYASGALALEGGLLRAADLRALAKRPSLGGGPESGFGGPDGALVLDDLWFRYARDEAWVLRGADLSVAAGEVCAVVGGNGSGKSTLLSVAAGSLRARRGRVGGAARAHVALLPQQPKALLGCETVAEELAEWANHGGYGTAEVAAALEALGLADADGRHPYDLSGGQQQLLALEKLLLLRPQLLLLDEPTKGLDLAARRRLAARVASLSGEEVAVVVATHDMAFVQAVAHTVSLLFDGIVSDPEPTSAFFARSWMWRP